ncbi:MAG: DNA polymerase III subunit gamma/tau [candidate division SR1 bacterium]|nr:DNA polymerase III subunit gamma/tau [candidate division SR1 bacterium]
MAWYNTYRPQTFEDVIGQTLVKSVLQNSLIRNKIKHAYLLNGPKGVGKTTIARIFANKLNDIATKPESRIDIIEMDAASNTGIDDIRQLIESAKIPPISGKFKIFIIDEVHMLSKSAMNALLKILEEPPTYIVFLLATTNPEKLIPTVLSRLTKLNLSAHTEQDIISRLKFIAEQEKLNIDEASLKIIAKRSTGSQRDAINLMETLSAYELDTYNKNNTAELLGLLPEELLNEISKKIIQKKFDTNLISLLEKTGMDGESVLIQLLEYLLDKSFTGDETFDALVPPIASLLESKLPITSVSAVLALLQITMKNINSQSVSKFSIQNDRSQQPFDQPQPIKEIKLPEISQPEEVVTKVEKSVKNITFAQEFHSTTESIAKIILELSKETSSPPIFKMLAPDLIIEKVENNIITFSVTNGIFVAQLGSEKLQQWLKDNLNQRLGGSCTIKVEQRKSNAIKPQVFESEEIIKVEKMQKNEFKNEAVYTVKLIEKTIEKPSKDDIFYKVYDSLPEEIKNSKVPIYLGEIPDPTEKGGKEENWDSHVDDMFEFE